MNDSSGKRIFSRMSYEENDNKAKNAVRKYLDSKGLFTLVPKENYGVDIHSYNSGTGIMARHEVEMKNQWTGDWPYDWKEVRIPGRKGKLLDKAKTQDINFWVIREDARMAWVIKGEVMTKDRLLSVSIRPCPEGEDFYCIPVSDCILIDLT